MHCSNYVIKIPFRKNCRKVLSFVMFRRACVLLGVAWCAGVHSLPWSSSSTAPPVGNSLGIPGLGAVVEDGMGGGLPPPQCIFNPANQGGCREDYFGSSSNITMEDGQPAACHRQSAGVCSTHPVKSTSACCALSPVRKWKTEYKSVCPFAAGESLTGTLEAAKDKCAATPTCVAV